MLTIALTVDDAERAFALLLQQKPGYIQKDLRDALVDLALGEHDWLTAERLTLWHTHILNSQESADNKSEDMRALLMCAERLPDLYPQFVRELPADICHPLLRWDRSAWPQLEPSIRPILYAKCIAAGLLNAPLAEATFEYIESQELLFGNSKMDMQRLSIAFRTIEPEELRGILNNHAARREGLVAALTNALALPAEYMCEQFTAKTLQSVIAQYLETLPSTPPDRRSRAPLATAIETLSILQDTLGLHALLGDPRLSYLESFHVGRRYLRARTEQRRFADVPRDALQWALRSQQHDEDPDLLSWATTADDGLRYHAARASLRTTDSMAEEFELVCLRSSCVALRIAGLESLGRRDPFAYERLFHIAASAPDDATRSIAIHGLSKFQNVDLRIHALLLNELARPVPPRRRGSEEDHPARLEAARALCRRAEWPFETTLNALFSAGLARGHYYIWNALRTWFDPACKPDTSEPVGLSTLIPPRA